MPTLDEAWQFYMSTVPPEDRYDMPSGDFRSGYIQGKAAGATAEREAVLAIIANAYWMRVPVTTVETIIKIITRRIRERGEDKSNG